MSDPITRLNHALEGRYRIEREVGEGGMATVYLARDEKHNRKVALKVLKPELAAVVGAARFLAEIETTANLQHPHILPLFDSGEADGFLFYVMPYVEGESLRGRLEREHQLPVDDAVRIATNMAEALDYAHRQGVIHRDIKPANLLLQDGKPVITDFGIALAVGAAGGGRLTETGLSLGTPHYMSPEQATGDAHTGPATDIYALGSVLYEMLVGEPPFTGSTPQAVLGKIITGEVRSAQGQRSSVPPNVDAAIRRALEKVPADRFGAAAAMAVALGDPSFRHGRVGGAGAGEEARRGTAAGIAATAAVAGLVGFALGNAIRTGPDAPPQVARFAVLFRPGQEPLDFSARAFTMSPDGSMLVYRGPVEGSDSRQLWMLRWGESDATPIPGTDPAYYPDISHDGRQVAFHDDDRVFVVSVDGGSVRELAEGSFTRWGPNDEYVYFRGLQNEVWRVRSPGGEPERLTRLGEDETSHVITDLLPGGEQALVRVELDAGDSEIRLLTLASGAMQYVADGYWPRYVRSGHILFLTGLTESETLMAVPFDLDRGTTTGPARALIEHVSGFSISDAGDLVYTGVLDSEPPTELVWVDRRGEATPVDSGWRFANPAGFEYGWRLSPRDDQIAYTVETDGDLDVWVKDLPSGIERQLTFDSAQELMPFWSPDGARIAYLRGPDLAREVWLTNADGSGQPSRLIGGSPPIRQGRWSQDGTWLVLHTRLRGSQGPRDILTFRPGTDTIPVPLLASPVDSESEPALSRDARWLAYQSTRTASVGQLFVSPFPNVDDGVWPISGWIAPVWSHSGDELFFVTRGGDMVSAAIETEPTFSVVSVDTLFTIPDDVQWNRFGDFYDVSMDDRRFLMGRAYGAEGATDQRYVVIQNYVEELRERAPTR